jgi:hypothetical protein
MRTCAEYQSSAIDIHIHAHLADHEQAILKVNRLADRFNELAEWNGGTAEFAVFEESPKRADLACFAEAVDLNHNQAVDLQEVARWRDLMGVLLRAQGVVALIDYESSIFAFLDRDDDGALSAAELSNIWERCESRGLCRGDQLRMQRVPRQLRVFVGNGAPQDYLPEKRTAGPDWFHSMDRNHDGVLSSGEFLGGSAKFKSLDTDGDNQLLPAEVE